ncbi:hypothetical protein RvY_13572 [Ramazzottius varieornatus]|uniref:Cytochrome b5 heme-binding domain-containing protein n=1 Tax=Ramazzottius varieornatus TaxID=947166 RepID=A0A1D1VNB4_RAMVA|nr:hypothetical protein RvY_13572 [Ramazzottius varieornatus]
MTSDGARMSKAEEQTFSWSEISQHTSANSLWVVVRDKTSPGSPLRVYDVTNFQKTHPGGHLILLKYAGTECSRAFAAVGHSKYAIKRMSQYRIGIAEADNVEPRK